MPDLSILIELADFYDVDIREIIDGERKSEVVNSEMKDTLKKVAEYSEAEHQKLKTRVYVLTLLAGVFLLLHMLLGGEGCGLLLGELRQNLRDFSLGATFGLWVLNALYLSGRLDRLRQWKLRIFKKK